MNELLKKLPKASAHGASSGLSKKAIGDLNREMTDPSVGTVYDRDYQTGHKNPWMDSRTDDQVPVANDPKSAGVDLSTGMVDGHDRILPPRDKNIRSETTKKEMDSEKKKDEEGFIAAPKFSFDLTRDRNGRIARKVASNGLFRQFASAQDIKVDSNSLIINIPRGKVALAQFGIDTALKMEKELSAALRVRAKFAHIILASGFDGISLEFFLV